VTRFDFARYISRQEALRSLPGPKKERFRELFRHGSLALEIYAPVGTDPQTPHTRDEAYVVIQGTASFVIQGNRLSGIGPGDFLFAAEVLGAGRAQATARAGKAGALVLFAPRSTAHELLLSVPTLIEILAG